MGGAIHRTESGSETDIGFAEARVEASPPARSTGVSISFFMLDFERGRVLHQIKKEGPLIFRLGPADFNQGFGTPYLTRKGRHLYLAGHYSQGQFHRFRIDGEDLIYEKTFKGFPCFMGERGVVCRKPKPWSFVVYGLDEKASHELDAGRREIGAAAISPRSGAICFLDRKGVMCVFDADGTQTGSFTGTRATAYALLPHPGGGRFLGWGNQEVVYYDLDMRRLEAAFQSPADDPPTHEPASGKIPPLTPGNLLTSFPTTSRASLFEFTPQGKLVQFIEIPKPPDAVELYYNKDPCVLWRPEESVHVRTSSDASVRATVEQTAESRIAAAIAAVHPCRLIVIRITSGGRGLVAAIPVLA